MAVPFIDLKRFEPDFLERWAEICDRITRNTQFVGGPEAVRLEERLVARTGAAAAVACANGTDALQLALRAVGVGPGDVVLIPDATFWATFEAVANVGARVVTVDIDMGDLQMDFHRFVEAVEEYRPKAAILVHLYGWASARTAEFRSFCREHNLPLVEDGAQAFDVVIDGESIFRDALVSTISFYPAKVIGSCGDAGAVMCESAELAERVRSLANHGRTTHYGHGVVGWNSRIGGFDAAWLNLCLDYIDLRIASRRGLAARYRDLYTQLGLCRIPPPANVEENGYLTVTMFEPERRPHIEAALKERGIGFGIVYPGTMSGQPGAGEWLAGKVGGENAEKLCQSVLNLPLFAYMKDEEFDEVAAVLESAVRQAGVGS